MKVSIAIPAYRPGKQLPELVQALSAAGVETIVVVDDGSGPQHDGLFRAVAQLPRVHLLRHAVNLGKGAALKTALNFALAEFPGNAGVVTADADGQHEVQDILAVAKILAGRRDALVLGVRQFDRAVPLRSRIGNTLTRHIMRLLAGQKLADTQTGLRGVPNHLIPYLLKLPSSGYEFELDMLMACKHRSCPIVQHEIRTIYIDRNRSSHFNPLLDSMRIYFVLFRFALASLSTAIIDNAVFAVVYYLTGGIVRAQVVARLVALTYNYTACRRMVFLSQQRHAVVFPKYLLLVTLSGFASYGLIQLLLSLFAAPVITAKIAAETLLFIANFAVQRDLIFTRRRGEEQATDWDRYYRRVPPTARLTRRYTTAVLIQALKRFAGATGCGTLVEIGGANSCFFDAIRKEIAPRAYHVIDNNQYGLDLLRDRVGDSPEVALYRQDVLAVRAGPRADVVFSVGLIEHFPESGTRTAIRAHFDLLKPGGVAIISFPTPTWLYRTARYCCELAGAWRFPDERPLARAEVAATIEESADIVYEKTLWPLVFTQRLIVARKRTAA